MCELPGFSAISGLPGVAGQGLRSLEVTQSASYINTETHTDIQTHTHTHTHLGGCGLSPGELGQKGGMPQIASPPLGEGVEGAGGA